VDADHEHVLVLRAVEDRSDSTRWNCIVNTPKKIVCELVCGRLPKLCHTTALGFMRKKVTYRSILATGVHALKADQNGALPVGVEQLL